jgi:hypothetical protein
MRRNLLAVLAVSAVAALLAVPIGTASAVPPQVERFHDEGSFSIGPCASGVTLAETYARTRS